MADKPKKVKRKQRPGRFGKIYCDFLSDVKLSDLMELRGGREACSLWALATAWTALHLTDGHIPRSALRTCYGRPKDAANLVAVGIWDEVDGGWQMRRYYHGNITRADVEALSLSGAISQCGRWMKDAKNPRACSCGHHTELGDLVGDPVGDLLLSLLPPEAFDA